VTVVPRKTSPKAFISGITGQDGSYLAELLLAKGYEVHGIIRRTSTFNTDRLDHIYSDPHERDVSLHLHYGDLANAARLSRLLNEIQPDEIYNLGAQSHVRVSFICGVVNSCRMVCLSQRDFTATAVPLTSVLPFLPSSE